MPVTSKTTVLFDKGPTDDKVILSKQIAFISAHSNEGRRMLAIAAASCILYTIKTKDPSLATELVRAIGASNRQETLVKWFLEFGPYKIGEDKESLEFKAHNFNKFEERVTNDKIGFATQLVHNPFWLWSPPKNPFEPFSLESLIEKAIEKTKKAKGSKSKLSEEEKAQIDAFGLDEAEAFLRALRTKRYAQTNPQPQPTIN